MPHVQAMARLGLAANLKPCADWLSDLDMIRNVAYISRRPGDSLGFFALRH